MKFPTKDELEKLRARYPSGATVRLISTDDPYTKLKSGSIGVVDYLDDAGTVHINWRDGGTLGMIPGVDDFDVLPVKEREGARPQPKRKSAVRGNER